MFVPSMGSKSGLKYCGIFIVFFPYIWYTIQLKYKSFFILLLCLLLPFAIKEKLSIKFMDAKHSKLTSLYSLPYVNNVYTSSDRTNFSDSILSDYNKYKDCNIVFYGLNSYMYNYSLLGGSNLFDTYRMNLNNKSEANKALELIKNNSNTVFFVVSNQLSIKNSIFEAEIINQNYYRNLKNG